MKVSAAVCSYYRHESVPCRYYNCISVFDAFESNIIFFFRLLQAVRPSTLYAEHLPGENPQNMIGEEIDWIFNL